MLRNDPEALRTMRHVQKPGRRARLILVAAACAAALPAAAQTYPSRTIRMIVPFAPGGNMDIVARTLTSKLAEDFGQQIVLDNRTGASGIIGTELAARSAPDGYTLLIVGSGHVMNPAVVKSLPYDSVRDFTPIGIAADVPTTLVVHPSLPARSVKELIALAKARPGELNYSTAGRGTNGHLAGEMLSHMGKVKLVHVPYRGSAPALTDLFAGQVHMTFTAMASVIQYARAGRLRMLAQTGETRSPAAPEVPTMGESGLPGFVMSTGYSVFGPAGMPAPVVERLNSGMRKVLTREDVKKGLASHGVDAVGSTPGEHDAFNRSEIAKWTKVAREAGIVPE